jgi:hypothetical protein
LHGHAIVDRNKLESVYSLDPRELRTRLERALHTTITSAEWAFLDDVGLLHEHEIGASDWSEFRRGVADNLGRIRRFRENDQREQAGDLEEEPRENGVNHQPENPPIDLDDRTSARSSALGALNHLRSGGSAPPRAPIHGTLLPCGGVDGTIPQWVYVIAVELWMPATEVAKSFRAMQQALMVGTDQPRTQVRAYAVARHVWEMEAAHGERLTWPEMCKRWNDAPMTRPFEHWRDFRANFVRGAKATLPRYKATDEEITKQVREASNRGAAIAFDRWVSQVRAATVQPGAR